MSRHPAAAAALMAGLLAIAGPSCDRVASEDDAVVVSLGERDLTEGALDRFIASRTELGGTLDAPLLSALLEEFVREQLLVIAAEEEGVEVSEVQLLTETSALRRGPGPDAIRPEGDAAPPENAGEEPGDSEGPWLRSQVRERLLVDRFMDTVVLADLEATDEALQLEFDANRAFYARPETVTLSERRFDDREGAEAAAERLREEPPSPEDDDAGDSFLPIGSFRRGELPDAVDQAVFALDPGGITDAVETAAGFRVFRVDRRLAAAALEFEEVQDVVRLTVLRQEADARVQALLEGLQSRHPVRVHADNLTFPYVGRLPRAE
ncbi:MAG: peptidylprolyl isomerase [Acidobacteria bacterium]|nr:peptidylprolyl isomerase [Acidobacteriota bacterium]